MQVVVKKRKLDDIHKRIGRFSISSDLIREYPEAVMKIMSKIIVVRCEHMYYNNTMHYTAISPEFPLSEEGFVIQDIPVSVEIGENGQIDVQFGVQDAPDRFKEILT